jgi:hypothetical protein
MIERTFDAEFLNRICNLPEVRPGLGGEGYLDTSELVSDERNFVLRTEHGGFILVPAGAGFYGVHTQFAAGSPLPVHDDEPAHDRMVGAVSRMCHRGQARKGVILYNCWANAARYVPIALLADNPPLVDVVDGVVSIEGGAMKVLAVKH